MKWNINVYYQLSKKKGTHPGAAIREKLQGINVMHLDDNVYSGEATDQRQAAIVLGEVLQILASPETGSKTRCLTLTVHAKRE